MDPSLSLFERYRAMFALRNIGTKDAVLALATGFGGDSPLFRCVRLPSPFPPLGVINFSSIPPPFGSHEIAYVFGQMSSEYSVPALIKVLETVDEADMVRHEAAEALGGIATDECLPVLQRFAKDSSCPRVVKESCEVALDMVCFFSSSSRCELWSNRF